MIISQVILDNKLVFKRTSDKDIARITMLCINKNIDPLNTREINLYQQFESRKVLCQALLKDINYALIGHGYEMTYVITPAYPEVSSFKVYGRKIPSYYFVFFVSEFRDRITIN